jgi:signal transduction histidine kinase
VAHNLLSDEGIRGVVINARDITERRRAEEVRGKLEAQVLYAQKLESLGVLAGGIAHDFNNLLTGVLGNADLALTELSPLAPARANIQQIEVAARRAADLTRQMLAYSGRGKFVIQSIRLSEIVEEMTHLLEVSISKKCVLRYGFAEDLPAIDGDATQLRQVVMNLIINASESIGERSGVIAVRTGAMECDLAYLAESYLDEKLPEGVYVYLEVADTGCGMTEEVRAKLFDPFFTTKFTGRGLGLAAVLGIVRSHRGAIKVHSELGVGTTFRVLFPISERICASDLSVTQDAPTWLGSGTILIVDDDETVRALAKKMMERYGFTVMTATDGREGLELFRAHHTTLRAVLLDMTMPHMDGEEAFREMRRITGNVPVVLTSGYSEQDATNRFAGKGLAGFVQKPFRTDDLMAAIRKALGS